MTLRSSDLQSDSDLDSIHNSCDVLRLAYKASHKSVYEQLWYFVNLYPILFQIVKTVSHDIILQEWDPRRIYRVSISQCFCKTLHKYNKNETHFVSHTLLVTSLHCRWTSTTSHICLGRSSHLINQIRTCSSYFLQWWCKWSSSNLLFDCHYHWGENSRGTFWVSRLFSPFDLFFVFHVADLLINKPVQDL